MIVPAVASAPSTARAAESTSTLASSNATSFIAATPLQRQSHHPTSTDSIINSTRITSSRAAFLPLRGVAIVTPSATSAACSSTVVSSSIAASPPPSSNSTIALDVPTARCRLIKISISAPFTSSASSASSISSSLTPAAAARFRTSRSFRLPSSDRSAATAGLLST